MKTKDTLAFLFILMTFDAAIKTSFELIKHGNHASLLAVIGMFAVLALPSITSPGDHVWLRTSVAKTIAIYTIVAVILAQPVFRISSIMMIVSWSLFAGMAVAGSYELYRKNNDSDKNSDK